MPLCRFTVYEKDGTFSSVVPFQKTNSAIEYIKYIVITNFAIRTKQKQQRERAEYQLEYTGMKSKPTTTK